MSSSAALMSMGKTASACPLGMHGYRLEVETHIITASAASVENLRQCVANCRCRCFAFVLNPLASAEVVLNETERQMGVVVCDIGGGTTDMAIYIDGDVWHTAVLGGGRQPHHLGYCPWPAPADVSGRGDQDPARACHLGGCRRPGVFQHPSVWRGGNGADQPPGAGRRSSRPGWKRSSAWWCRRSSALGMMACCRPAWF